MQKSAIVSILTKLRASLFTPGQKKTAETGTGAPFEEGPETAIHSQRKGAPSMKQITLVLLMFLAFGAMSQAQKKEKAKVQKTEVIKEAKMICPVTGEEADPEVSFVHKGTKYYFCCTGCIGKFKKDPAKFIKASSKNVFDPCDDEGEKAKKVEPAKPEEPKSNVMGVRYSTTQDEEKAVINTGKDLSAQIVNEKCSVMAGKKVDPKVTTVSYKGKVYGFCCKSCIKKFANNPEKYLQPADAGKKVEKNVEPKKL
jgi:YHS domain-containing protein